MVLAIYNHFKRVRINVNITSPWMGEAQGTPGAPGAPGGPGAPRNRGIRVYLQLLDTPRRLNVRQTVPRKGGNLLSNCIWLTFRSHIHTYSVADGIWFPSILLQPHLLLCICAVLVKAQTQYVIKLRLGCYHILD